MRQKSRKRKRKRKKIQGDKVGEREEREGGGGARAKEIDREIVRKKERKSKELLRHGSFNSVR